MLPRLVLAKDWPEVVHKYLEPGRPPLSANRSISWGAHSNVEPFPRKCTQASIFHRVLASPLYMWQAPLAGDVWVAWLLPSLQHIYGTLVDPWCVESLSISPWLLLLPQCPVRFPHRYPSMVCSAISVYSRAAGFLYLLLRSLLKQILLQIKWHHSDSDKNLLVFTSCPDWTMEQQNVGGWEQLQVRTP